MITADLSTALPELILAVYAMLALLVVTYGGQDRWASPLTWATALVFALLGLEVSLGSGAETAFHGAFIADGFARFAKTVILFGSAVMLLLSEDYMRRHGQLKYEFPILVAMAVLGMMVMVSAGDLMSLYMGLELQSLALYVVAAFRRDSIRSTEAGLKYFVLGALSSGLLLYGASLVYGYSGATEFKAIAEVVHAEGVSLGMLFGMAFLCAGLAFKVSAAPFHMWTPDVYEGSPTPVTAFFATAPKAAAAALFVRVLYGAFGDAVADWQQIIAFLAIASMFLGSIAAIGQTNLKRLLAYSSIGHMGFALVGLAAGTAQGATAVLVYLAIYVTMNVGVFAFVMCMERDGAPVTSIHDLAGLWKSQPRRAAALGALFFSLAGIPPLVGFFGKWYVFVAAVEAGLVPLAVAGAVASVIGAFYYLRVVKIIFLDEPSAALTGSMPVTHNLALAASALVMGLAWLPGVNLLGVPELAKAAAAGLF
ncbi:NADH-quinone oxidoreductase subunit NuoN [Rhodovulum sp. DZ06]|uniref:NADH-quinone oxidoreductase subunit NuoN n=1 Tax=Rhodovulum sp. DZ06 TaxID=3425126 RepID=UPI003D33A506